MRVLGVDPGLTRCGVAVVDVAANRSVRLVHVEVLRTPSDLALESRLLAIGRGLSGLFDTHRPEAFAIERVFAQQNVPSVMGVAQISGIALHLAAERGLPVGLHTPSEVKAAVTGYGNADKRQVTTMVMRLLGLQEAPKPADAADAIAIAVCHGWRQGSVPSARGGTMTPAQHAWRQAESSSRRARPLR